MHPACSVGARPGGSRPGGSRVRGGEAGDGKAEQGVVRRVQRPDLARLRLVGPPVWAASCFTAQSYVTPERRRRDQSNATRCYQKAVSDRATPFDVFSCLEAPSFNLSVLLPRDTLDEGSLVLIQTNSKCCPCFLSFHLHRVHLHLWYQDLLQTGEQFWLSGNVSFSAPRLL